MGERSGVILSLEKWIISAVISDEESLNAIESEIKTNIKEAKNKAWNAYQKPIFIQRDRLNEFLEEFMTQPIMMWN